MSSHAKPAKRGGTVNSQIVPDPQPSLAMSAELEAASARFDASEPVGCRTVHVRSEPSTHRPEVPSAKRSAGTWKGGHRSSILLVNGCFFEHPEGIEARFSPTRRFRLPSNSRDRKRALWRRSELCALRHHGLHKTNDQIAAVKKSARTLFHGRLSWRDLGIN